MTGKFDLKLFEQWTARAPATWDETLELRPVSGLAAMLDQCLAPAIGDVLPPLWHWVYFTPTPLASDIGIDGHPKCGGFLPPVPLPRRMWAGGTFRFQAPLYVGETVQRQSRISSIKLKQGASGPLVFVSVGHEISVAGELRIAEEQTLVYMGADQASSSKNKPVKHDEKYTWFRCIEPDPVMLFRYSALTSNSHRIHYDREYAVLEEGYPGLLVQAPLTATLLAELLRENCPDLHMTHFAFRALRPLVDTRPFSIYSRLEGDGSVALWALDADKVLAVQASARMIES